MNAFEAFKNHLRIKGDKPQSIKNYDTYVAPFIVFSKDKDPKSIAWEYLKRYRREATRKTAWTHIKGFVSWCAANDLIQEDWTRSLRFRFTKAAPPPVLSPEEFQRILAIIPKTRRGRRDRAVLVTIYYTGARRTSISSLRRADINIKDRIIRVETKYSKELFLPLPRPAADELNAWLAWSAKINSKFAFPSFRNHAKPINEQYITHALPKYASAAKISKRVFVHLLRHTYATELHRAGVPLETIKDLMGHSSIMVTADYVRWLASATRAREAVDRIFG